MGYLDNLTGGAGDRRPHHGSTIMNNKTRIPTLADWRLAQSGPDRDHGLAHTGGWARLGALTALALVCSGCATGNPLLSSGPAPRVEDCMLLQQATPTKYVCGGKTYTAVQLAEIRTGGGTTH
jgi:hypothetical protein